ncbi:hypothetical protein DV451_001895 [Geotrichum candidum]|uniref:NmrA-like domain-containing protein n=1 Tax=Geotrichum candidum TaxID=1173061 RepID=A0A9P5G5Z0_GEOCN|nr:hypothetical protein DV451_001895 [Geotrichum candidum]
MSVYKPTVAILGINGAIGVHALNAFLSPTFSSLFTLPIRIVTRDPSKIKANVPAITDDNVKFYNANIATGEGLATVFEGVDVIINLLGTEVSHTAVIEAAAAAKPKVYIPSEFGTDIPASGPYANLFKVKTDAIELARSKGLKTVSIITSAFSEWLFLVPALSGINFPESGQFQYYGDDSVKIGTTSLVDIGKVIASVASKNPATLPDYIRVAGDVVSPRKVSNAYTAVTGQKLTDVALPLEEITTPARKIAKEGPKSGNDFLVGLRGVLYDHYLVGSHEHNEFVSKGLFKFTPFTEVAKRVLGKN